VAKGAHRVREGTKDTAIALSSRVAVLLFGIAIQSALAWLLGPDGRGSYAVCLLFGTLLGVVFTFGVDRAGQYFVASRKMEKAEGISSSLLLLLMGSAVGIAVGRALMLTGMDFFNKADHSSFLISLAIVPFVGLNNAFVLYFIGLRRFKWMAVVEVVNIAAHLVLTLVLVLGFGMGVNGALLAIVAAGVTSSGVSVALLRREGALRVVRRTPGAYGRLLSYGARFFVAKLSNVFHFRIGTMILAFFVEPSAIGLFAAASALVMRITIVPKSVETALFSRVAGHSKGRPELVAQAARLSAMTAGVALVLLALVARPLVRVVLSPSFLPAVALVWVIIPGIFLRASTMVMAAYFMGTDRPAVCSFSVGLGTLANLVLLLLLLPVMGLSGAAWAMTGGYLVSSLILVLAFARASGQGFRETWLPTREDVRLLRELPAHLRGSLVRARAGALPGEPKGEGHER